MTNTFLTPSVIAQAALATLYQTCVAAQLVYRDYSPEFAAQVGDTVTVRKPSVFTAQEFTDGGNITVQNATEGSVAVVLNHQADVSFAVTSRQMTLDIEDFAMQLLDPAMEAISQKIDRDVLLFRNDITQVVGTGTALVGGIESTDLWSTSNALVDAGAVLDIANVPTLGRHAITGPATKGKWLKDPILQKANESGSTAALRQGSIGDNLYGFDAYMSQNIGQPASSPTTGQPTTEVNVAFHTNAVALVTRQLELPAGAYNAAIATYKGFGIRVVYGYNQTTKTDTVSLDSLYGVKTLDPNRAVLIQGPLHA